MDKTKLTKKELNEGDKLTEKYKKRYVAVHKATKPILLSLVGLLGGGAIATAVVVPTVIKANSGSTTGETREVSIEEAIEHVKCYSKMNDGNIEIALVADSGYEVTGVSKITINNQELASTDYTYKDSAVTIKKDVLSAHSGKIVVKPAISQISEFINITIANVPNRFVYTEGETVDFKTGLLVKALKSNGEYVDISNDELDFSIPTDHVIDYTDLYRDIPVTISLKKDKTKTAFFNIYAHGNIENLFDISDEGVLTPEDVDKLPKYVLIPSSIDGKDVVALGVDCFSDCEQIEGIDMSMSKNIKRIGGACFYGCTNLKRITLNDGLESLGTCDGSDRFSYCTSLSELHFPSSITAFSMESENTNFENCKSLNTLIIDSKTIANFKYQDSGDQLDDLTLFKYAKNVYVKNDIVLDSDSYINLNFKKEDTSDKAGYDRYTPMEYEYFINKDKQSVSIGDGLIFNSGKVVLPSTFGDYKVTEIHDGSFRHLDCIYEVELSEYITSLGAETFSYCPNLKKIHLTSNLVNVGTCDNFDCNELETVLIDSKTIVVSPESGYNYLFNNSPTVYIKNDLVQFVPESAFENEGYVKDESGTSPEIEGYTPYIKSE